MPRCGSRFAPGALVSAIGLIAACERAPDEVVLFVDTDAPVATGVFFDTRIGAEKGAPSPLFDRIEFRVTEPPCEGCARSFAVDAAAFRESRVSVGLPFPADRPSVDVRVTLYLGAGGGEPGAASLARTVRLERPTGRVEKTVLLLMNAFFEIPGESSSPGVAAQGSPGPSREGSWEGAARRGCGGDGPAGATCVPSGTFWMHRNEQDRADQTLVHLDPFWLDATEVTSAAYVAAGGQLTTPLDSRGYAAPLSFCTARADPSGRPALPDHPVNCVNSSEAQSYCAARGGALPTAAQFEYASRALGTARLPWGGNGRPGCDEAVVGRSGDETATGNSATTVVPAACSEVDPVKYPIGPAKVATARDVSVRDRLVLAGGATVWDLSGNLSEWVLDDHWELGDSANGLGCTPSRAILRDPICRVAGAKRQAARGGNFILASWPGDALFTRPRSGPDADYLIGFRCAYPDRR